MKAKINPQRRAIGGEAQGVAEKQSKRKKRTFDIAEDDKGCGKLKRACCQGAVTIPWPQACSILKWIGGDISMLPLSAGMSSLQRYYMSIWSKVDFAALPLL